MADPVISVLVERLFAAVEAMVSEEISLVRGAKKEAQKLAITMKGIQSVLNDAEDRRVEERVRFWLEQLQEIFYDMDEVFDDWNTAALKRKIETDDEVNVAGVSSQINQGNKVRLCSFPSPFSCFKQVSTRRGIALAIKELNERLEFISKSKDQLNLLPAKFIDDESEKFNRIQTSSLVDESDIIGLDFEKESLISKLLLDNNEKSINVISIVGTGGLGKTTLAQLAFNDDRLKSQFDHRIWVCVSDPFDEIQVAKKFIESVTGSSSSLTSLDSLLNKIIELVSGQKILLVFDDVWPHESRKWEQLRISLKNIVSPSKVLVTTRDIGVAKSMGTTHFQDLNILSESDCWSLVCKTALPNKSEAETREFEIVGKEISKRCMGLPLAAKTIASVLLLKQSVHEWQCVRDSKIWELKAVKVDLFPHLFLSFSQLPLVVRHCFKYCSVFPKDYRIETEKIIRMWISQGYIMCEENNRVSQDDKGYECVENMVMCSFFHEVYRDRIDGKIESFKIHDIVHDFAMYLMEKDCCVMESENTRKEKNIPFRHMTLPNSFKAANLSEISSVEKLRTLFAERVYFDKSYTLSTFLVRMKDVRCLKLSSCELKEVPTEIKSLIRLRYLDLSSNYDLKELPDEICDLCNLETLDITYCDRLSKLPERIGRLINLKYLLMEEKVEVPKGLLKLTNLQSIARFKVGKCHFKLGDLKFFKQLQGKLWIQFADDTKDIFDDCDVLGTKDKIKCLALEAKPSDSKRQFSTDMLTALQSPPNLFKLEVRSFSFESSDWIVTSAFCNVRNLYLSECVISASTPLWKMQHLESLVIFGPLNLEHVGTEFMGIESSNSKGNSKRTASSPLSSSSSMPIVAFPKLKRLEFSLCEDWKKWEDLPFTDRDVVVPNFMPCLEELHLFFCKKLEDLPHRLLSIVPNLKLVRLSFSTHLVKKYEEDGGWGKMPWLSRVRSEILPESSQGLLRFKGAVI